jgi:HlyD family secretion protein
MAKIAHTLQVPLRWFMNTRRRNRFIILALLLGLFLFVRARTQVSPQDTFVTQAVNRADIVALVSETGNVGGVRVDVYSGTTGVIEEIYVENGEQVAVNQSLFRVRSTATESEKAAANATFQAAQVAYQTAQNNLRSAQATADKVLDEVKGHETDETFAQRQARTTAEVARDNAADAVRSAQAQLNSARLAYQATQNMIVKSPTAGVVANLSSEIGDKVTVSSVTTTASPVLVLTNPADYSIRLSINEVDIAKVREGQVAKVSLDAFPDEEFKAIVTSVDSVGTNTSGVVTYEVKLELLTKTDMVRSGMTANVDIEVEKATNVLSVQNSAIKPYQGKKAVQVVNSQSKKPEYVPVEIGIKGLDRTEIKSGVQEGIQVITGTKNAGVERTTGSPFGN